MVGGVDALSSWGMGGCNVRFGRDYGTWMDVPRLLADCAKSTSPYLPHLDPEAIFSKFIT